jgi:hypothetical protein
MELVTAWLMVGEKPHSCQLIFATAGRTRFRVTHSMPSVREKKLALPWQSKIRTATNWTFFATP